MILNQDAVFSLFSKVENSILVDVVIDAVKITSYGVNSPCSLIAKEIIDSKVINCAVTAEITDDLKNSVSNVFGNAKKTEISNFTLNISVKSNDQQSHQHFVFSTAL